MARVILSNKHENPANIHSLSDSEAHVRLSSVSAKARVGVVYLTMIPRGISCAGCARKTEDSPLPKIRFKIPPMKALRLATHLLGSAEDATAGKYEIGCLLNESSVGSEPDGNGHWSCPNCGHQNDYGYGALLLTRRASRLFSLALIKSAQRAFTQSNESKERHAADRRLYSSIIAWTVGIGLSVLLAASLLTVPPQYESWRTPVLIIAAQLFGLVLGGVLFLAWNLRPAPKTIKRAYVFAFGVSLVSPMIAYLVLLPLPVPPRLALQAALSQLAVLLFFDFHQWSKGTIEGLADPPPTASELRPSLETRKRIFWPALVFAIVVSLFHWW